MTKGPYTCVYRKLWDKEEFWAMSIVGRLVFLNVLSGRYGNGLGLYAAGIEAMSEAARIPSPEFRKGFKECLGAGLVQYDEGFQVVYVPKYVDHNMPSNPNVIKSWERVFSAIPKSILKSVWLKDVRVTIDGVSDSFAKAFNDTLCEVLGGIVETLPEGLSGNGETLVDKDSELEKDPGINSPSDSLSATPTNAEGTRPRVIEDKRTEKARTIRPESVGYDRSKLRPIVRVLGDTLFNYFPHLGDWQCDEWAHRLNSEYGSTVDLVKLFKEVGETDKGNTKKIPAGREWGHIRSWCRNAEGTKEFAISGGSGTSVGGIDVFKAKNGSPRFTGLFKQPGKSLRECIDAASEDGSVPREMVEQWEADLKGYEGELNE